MVNLIGSDEQKVRVHLNATTEAKGLHIEKRTDFDFFSWAIWMLSGGTVLQNFSDPIKQVAYEGNVLTVSGVLKYNIKQGIYEIPDPRMITTGGIGNLYSILSDKFTSHVKSSLYLTCGIVLVTWFLFSSGVLVNRNQHQVVEDEEPRDFEQERIERGVNERRVDACATEALRCKHCFDLKQNIVFENCGHMSLCDICHDSQYELTRVCPICDLESQSILKLAYLEDEEKIANLDPP